VAAGAGLGARACGKVPTALRLFTTAQLRTWPQNVRVEWLRCVQCGDLIGVYEPLLLVLHDGSHLTGSRLTLSAELAQPAVLAFHEHCFDALRDGPPGPDLRP
jgi:hypothetical protein